MSKKELIIIADYTQQTMLSYKEFCEVCRVSSDLIDELVQQGILEPHGRTQEEWLFSLDELPRVKKAQRLKRDFELHNGSLAIVLELLQQLEILRKHMELLEKHYTKIK